MGNIIYGYVVYYAVDMTCPDFCLFCLISTCPSMWFCVRPSPHIQECFQNNMFTLAIFKLDATLIKLVIFTT